MIPLLRAAELLYRGINRGRRWLYRNSLLPTRRLPRVVVSIGNLAVGGTGKTPAVIRIGRELAGRGYRIAVLTRGYGRAGGDEPGLVTAHDPDRYGDEPVLIAKALGMPVIVGANRYENAIRFLGVNDCDLFILDDGFQHLALARDIDIVIVRSGDAPLREGLTALRDASFVLWRDDDASHATEGPASFDGVSGDPRRDYRCSLQPIGFLTASGLEPLDAYRGRRAFAFSGLARNEQFFRAVTATGLVLAGCRRFPDHHRYTPDDLAALRHAAQEAGAGIIVTTEKDAVKIGGGEMIALATELQIEPEGELIDALVERIEAARRRIENA
ncbi:MAG TPA: tetraacyldisaccharide 4'-kinase [Thermoanaerobaculia bacterium]|nr:tetraacyldisaccharide 4'-kinase [Thermoanaerobaculia bacterium]